MAMTATLAPLSERSARPAALDAWPRLAIGVLDLLDQAVLVVSSEYQILGVNRLGETLLREGDGLAAVQQSLVASTPRCSFELRRAIERALRGEALRIQVTRRERSHLSVAVEPLPGRPGVAVVFANDPERRRDTGFGDLASRYGFTPTECEVAQRLATGSALESIAAALGITLNTVRGHLKHLYTKAGVHRQAELVAKLLAG